MDEGFRRLSGEWMTPRRRFLSALYGGRVDKVPAMTLSSVMTLEAMDIADAEFPEAHLDAEKMARLAATADALACVELAKKPAVEVST